MHNNIRRHTTTILLLVPIVFVLIGYVIYPLWNVFYKSLFIGQKFTFQNYIDFFDIRQIYNLEALWHSIWISILSVIIAGTIGVLLAFLLTKYKFWGADFLKNLAITPIILPSIIVVFAFVWLYDETGIITRGIQHLFGMTHPPFGIKGFSGILVVHAYTMYVYFFIMAKTAFENLDISLEEAAQNLGAGKWSIFTKITIPLLTPSIVGASLLVFMISMASFAAPYVFAGTYRILSFEIFKSNLNGDFNMAYTQTIILAFISILFLIILRWVSGKKSYVYQGKGIGVKNNEIMGWKQNIITVPIVLLLVLSLILPHLIIILMSFVKEGTWTTQIFPTVYTLDNYRDLFSDPFFFKPILNSLLMSIIASIGTLIFGFASSYLIARKKFKGIWLLDFWIMLPWALPGTVIAINLISAFNEPTIITANKILVGSFWILPIAYFIKFMPIVVRTTTAAFEQLDKSIEDAAVNLGAGFFYTFKKIVFPNIFKGCLSGTLLVFIVSMGEFVSSIFLCTPNNKPIAIEINSQFQQDNIGGAAAFGVIQILIVLIIFAIKSFFDKNNIKEV